MGIPTGEGAGRPSKTHCGPHSTTTLVSKVASTGQVHFLREKGI